VTAWKSEGPERLPVSKTGAAYWSTKVSGHQPGIPDQENTLPAAAPPTTLDTLRRIMRFSDFVGKDESDRLAREEQAVARAVRAGRHRKYARRTARDSGPAA